MPGSANGTLKLPARAQTCVSSSQARAGLLMPQSAFAASAACALSAWSTPSYSARITACGAVSTKTDDTA